MYVYMLNVTVESNKSSKMCFLAAIKVSTYLSCVMLNNEKILYQEIPVLMKMCQLSEQAMP